MCRRLRDNRTAGNGSRMGTDRPSPAGRGELRPDSSVNGLFWAPLQSIYQLQVRLP